jgi:hypothetical protein
MHFFHPIQQSAQQIYHTALPVLRTFSQPDKPCLWSIAGNHPSHVTAFTGTPDTWGSLLRTIDVRLRRPTCIATSAQMIIATCEDIVDIYDAVTFVLRQSLRAPERVTKIRGSPDGSTLFFAHDYSVTMWDVQTGGLTHTHTHTFTTRSRINDMVVSTTGDHVACSSFNGSVVFWNNLTKEEGECFGNSERVVAIYWMSPLELAVATGTAVYIRNIASGETSNTFSVPGYVWGMVCLGDPGEFLVGTLRCFLKISKSSLGGALMPQEPNSSVSQSLAHRWKLSNPTLAGEEIVCITDNRGVQSFNHKSMKWTEYPSLLGAATSVAVSLNRNLVARTEDSIQIFSLDVLTSGEVRKNVWTSQVYPLGEKHIVCLLEPDRHLTILDLETLQELRPDDNTSPLQSLLKNQSPSARGFVAEFGIPVVMQMWQSGTPLPEWTAWADEDAPFGVLSPDCTRIVTSDSSRGYNLLVKDAKDGTVLARLPGGGYGLGKVYDVAFDSETRFHLKIDGPGGHVQIPHDIIASPSKYCSHTITKGEPVPLLEPRETPPYTLDANCEWVVDAESRKIFWVSPGNVRVGNGGNGGHFWVGLSLIMLGDDGVVRKLSFKEPDC